ncbi:MAG: hypothetical protein V1904_05565 [Bacteroidota bacterium]
MKNVIFIILVCAFIINGKAQKPDSIMVKYFYNEALSDDEAYNNLENLCTKIGGRLCGSPQSAAALEWAKLIMQSMDMDTIYSQKLYVHHWERGEKETASMASKVFGSKEVNVCALGESIATPVDGINAEVIEINNMDQLKKLGKKILTGKLVFF